MVKHLLKVVLNLPNIAAVLSKGAGIYSQWPQSVCLQQNMHLMSVHTKNNNYNSDDSGKQYYLAILYLSKLQGHQ